MQIVNNAEDVPLAARFKGEQTVFVVGSCWPEDLEVLAPFINAHNLKFIIAPHEISERFITTIERSLKVTTIRYSRADTVDPEPFQVLLVDNIGMLSRLYRYGEFAYVGGAFGKGLHKILEAACYGRPVFFGNLKFQNLRSGRSDRARRCFCSRKHRRFNVNLSNDAFTRTLSCIMQGVDGVC